MEPQENYIEELYGPGEYKLTWMLVVTFLALHVYFIYIKHAYFVTQEIHFGTIENSLLQKRVSVNKIMMRLVKLACKRLLRLIVSYDMVHRYVR